MECFGWLTPRKIFYLFVFNILAFVGITFGKTFGMACDLCRSCKDVVYGSYGPPIRNHVVICEPKLTYNFF